MYWFTFFAIQYLPRKNLVTKLNWDDTKNNIALSYKIVVAVICKSHKRLKKAL